MGNKGSRMISMSQQNAAHFHRLEEDNTVPRVSRIFSSQIRSSPRVVTPSIEDPPSALPLVYTDSGGRLQLDESVAQRCFLGSKVSEFPLCLICVIGEKRRGKSILLNYILRALQCLERSQPVSLGQEDEPLTGFEWRRGTDGVTKGIWIWSKPFILERDGKKLAVYVLDTEGSLDIEGDRETSIKLSALSMLLSSYLIFNVNAILKSTELDYLEMYLHVAKLTGESFSLKYLQHLDFLVRDWQDPDCCGREAAHAYLQHESEKLGRRMDSEYRNFLNVIRTQSVSGFLLPHPGNKFLKSKQGRLADMDDEFKGYLREYISDVIEGIWLHQKSDEKGREITCGHVGRLLKEFVAMLQSKKYSFASPLEMAYSLENYMQMKNILQGFQDYLDQQFPSGSSLEVLRVKPSKMRIRVNKKVTEVLEECDRRRCPVHGWWDCWSCAGWNIGDC
ncbi:RING finger protein 112-like [Pyxicephalus adspersus]|uniref:RING finger protein 112-like n=1 Tax=Pyxicephalus adspersus TaxID=30357 RepID=UPI003B5A5455